jgi:glycosyltransferase involved in cell wall biosynthesis
MSADEKSFEEKKVTILCQGGDFVSSRLALEAEDLEKHSFHTLWFLQDKKARSRNDIFPAEIIKPKKFPLLLFQIISLFFKRKIRLVKTYIMGNPKRTLFTALVSKILRKPNVVMLFGSETYFYKQRGLKSRLFVRIALYLADFVIYHHPILLNRLREYNLFNPEKTAYVHHGIKIKKLENFERKDKVVLYMNRFIWWKQPQLLIKAIPLVVEKIPDAKFIFLGVGDYPQEEMQAASLIKKLGVEKSVRFVPYAKDVTPYLQEASVFVNTSNIPFLNNSMLEAMERGIPPIALQLPDAEPIIEHGINGLLYQDKPEELAVALIKLLSNKKLRLQLGKSARKTIIEKYNINIVAEKYAVIFNNLIRKKLC